MTIKTRAIEDREEWLDWRGNDMTASVAACLFGADIHPYTTAFEQWALKSGLTKPRPMSAKLARRGHYVEKIAPLIILEDHPTWSVTPCPYYYFDTEERIGATPDLWGRRPDKAGAGVIDVKSVGVHTLQKWRDRDTGNTELPVWIAIQVNIQAAMVSATWGDDPVTWGGVAAITIGEDGLDCEILDVPILPGVFQNFRELAREFWRRVEAREPYPIDWGRDVGVILDLYGEPDGGVVDLSDDDEFADLLEQRKGYKQIEHDGEEAKKLCRTVNAQIINKLGNAGAARYHGALIKAPTVRVKEKLHEAYTYRRITVKGYEARDAGTSVTDDAAE